MAEPSAATTVATTVTEATHTSPSAGTTQPVAPTAPQQKPPAPTVTQRAAGGIPHHLLSSISISAPHEIKPIKSLESREVEQLTQQILEQYWKQLAEQNADDQKFHDLIADKRVELKNNNLFFIKVPNIIFDRYFRDVQDRIYAFLREKTGNEALQFRVAVDVEQREAVAYMPREKFEEMAQRNPAMHSLRKLFPDIDF